MRIKNYLIPALQIAESEARLRVEGKNTVTAIQSGILFGYEGLVKNVVTRIREELNTECPVIATGGLSSAITSLSNFFYSIEPNLTLDGLRIIGELVNNRK